MILIFPSNEPSLTMVRRDCHLACPNGQKNKGQNILANDLQMIDIKLSITTGLENMILEIYFEKYFLIYIIMS